jgi:hypothetical protein
MKYDTINWIERLCLILLAVVMKWLLYLLVIAICWSCNDNAGTEKHQGKRDNIINVRTKMKEIVIEDVLINSHAELLIIGDYLIVEDIKSADELIYLFNKNDFSFLAGTAHRGQGPGEIANIGRIGVDEVHRKFYVSDHGKHQIFSYDLDSVLANPSSYMPKDKMKLNEGQFPSRYQYINDTLSFGVFIEPIGNSSFQQITARWDINTGIVVPMKYTHPDVERKRICLAASMEHGIYVEGYHHHDLMTICSLNGDLKYNVYGAKWNDRTSNEFYYYGKVDFCGDRIVATYSGGHNFSDEHDPTKFLVFDKNGDYLQTLETGYKITDFCYDKDNNRILLSLDDEIQFAYLDLDEIVK